MPDSNNNAGEEKSAGQKKGKKMSLTNGKANDPRFCANCQLQLPDTQDPAYAMCNNCINISASERVFVALLVRIATSLAVLADAIGNMPLDAIPNGDGES